MNTSTSYKTPSQNLKFGAIAKYYNGSEWVECPSSAIKYWDGSQWITCNPNAFKVFLDGEWKCVRFQG